MPRGTKRAREDVLNENAALREELEAARERIAELEEVEAELRQAQEALRESEERYRSIVELAPDGIVTANLKGVATSCNSAFEELTGFSREEIVGTHVTRAPTLRLKDIPKYTKLLFSMLRGTEIEPFEFRWVRKDGSERWGEAHAGLMRQGSRTSGVQFILRDITVRKEAEEALRESEERYRVLFESFPLGVTIADSTGQIVESNEESARLLGISREEHQTRAISGEPWKIIRPDGSPMPSDEYASVRALEEGRLVENVEMGVVRPDGQVAWINVTAAPLGDQVVVTYNDITKRRRAEKALRESEALLRVAAASLDGVLYVLDENLDFVLSEGQGLTGLGLEPGEVVGLSLFDFLQTSDPNHPLVLEHRKALSGEAARFESTHGDRTFSTVVSPMRDEGGEVVGVVGLSLDITARKSMERELRQQERLAAVGQLAAGVAHDFRNILATVILYAQMDLRGPDVPPEVADHLRIILEEADRATDLVQQILDFSSRAMICRKRLDLVGFMDGTVEVLRRTIPEYVQMYLDVEAGQDAGAFTVLADAGRLRQALTNLALNARDAMPGGGELRFALSRQRVDEGVEPVAAAMEPGPWICLAVSDTGHGMTEDVQDHLFEPFFTTKDVDKGTGLGLAQVYGIVRQHEGAIDVESAPGEGTTFRIWLPACEALEDGVKGDAGARGTPWGQGETILLVEDNERLREAAAGILESLGYRVLRAVDGEEALAVHRAHDAVDLVVTDMVMPNMGGETLVRALGGEAGGVRAVGMTGYAVEKVVGDLRELGFVGMIQKPFDVEGLARVVRRAIERRDRESTD